MMVVGHDDLGLSLTLATATTNNDNNASPVSRIQNQMGFMMMMMNRKNVSDATQQLTHHLTTPSSNITSSSSSSSSLQLNLMMMSSSTPQPLPSLQKLSCNRSTDLDRNYDTCRSFLRGIDVNRVAGGGDEDGPGVSSPNSTVSTISGKRSSAERDSGLGEENEVERASSRGLSDDEDGGDNSRKKLRLTKDQSAILEESFKEHNTLNPKQKQALAKRLGLRPRQVEVWFQNRRARTKLKQTEVDCEFLKRCCEQLSEENRRLQKEVQELRALKLSPQFYMHMTPPTTLTMCPSCERVAVPPTTSTTPSQIQPRPDSKPANIRPMSWLSVPAPVRPFEAALHPRP